MPNFVQRWMLLALVLTLLNACGTASSNPACVCPPIKEYSRDFQKRLAEEIKATKETSAIMEVLMDYAKIRDQIRICK